MSSSLGQVAHVDQLIVRELGSKSSPVETIHTASTFEFQNDLSFKDQGETKFVIQKNGHLAVSQDVHLYDSTDIATGTLRYSLGLSADGTKFEIKNEVTNTVVFEADDTGSVQMATVTGLVDALNAKQPLLTANGQPVSTSVLTNFTLTPSGDGTDYGISLVTALALETFLESFQQSIIQVQAGQQQGFRTGTINTTSPSTTNVPSCAAVVAAINGATSSLQTQINGKQASGSGAGIKLEELDNVNEFAGQNNSLPANTPGFLVWAGALGINEFVQFDMFSLYPHSFTGHGTPQVGDTLMYQGGYTTPGTQSQNYVWAQPSFVPLPTGTPTANDAVVWDGSAWTFSSATYLLASNLETTAFSTALDVSQKIPSQQAITTYLNANGFVRTHSGDTTARFVVDSSTLDTNDIPSVQYLNSALISQFAATSAQTTAYDARYINHDEISNLNFLSGITSNVQTQLDALAAGSGSSSSSSSTTIESAATVLAAANKASQVVGTGQFYFNSTTNQLRIQYKATTSSFHDFLLAILDTTSPVVTLTGPASVTHQLGNTYTDAGATATDNVDGSITPVMSGTVDVNTPGTYYITYTATDGAGNSSTKVRTVVVADTQFQLITTLTNTGSLAFGSGSTDSNNAGMHINNPWNGDRSSTSAPAIASASQLQTISSNSTGTDLEVRIDTELSNGTTISVWYKGWHFSEVFDYSRVGTGTTHSPYYKLNESDSYTQLTSYAIEHQALHEWTTVNVTDGNAATHGFRIHAEVASVRISGTRYHPDATNWSTIKVYARLA